MSRTKFIVRINYADGEQRQLEYEKMEDVESRIEKAQRSEGMAVLIETFQLIHTDVVKSNWFRTEEK